MPTTPSSAASVTSADFCWAWREMGITRYANRHVSTATSGITRPAQRASSGFTTASTIETPTIIIALWIDWTTPQPMKYRTG